MGGERSVRPGRRVALALAAFGASTAIACGNLVIPQDSPGDDGGGDAAASADAEPPGCDGARPGRPRVHRPLLRLGVAHALARRPAVHPGHDHVGRRCHLAALGVPAGRVEDRHHRPERLVLPRRHQVLAGDDAPRNARRDALLVEGVAVAVFLAPPTPGRSTRPPRPRSRSASPTRGGSPTRSLP